MKKFFLIGICGISMSAIAVMLHKEGNEVCGCDRNYKKPPKCLIDENIKVFSENMIDGIKTADFVVFSSAIKEDNSAYVLAKKLNKKLLSRGEILGRIANKYEKVIAVAGSHGKTTTTAMIYHILSLAGKHPSLHLGGLYDGKNVICDGNEFLVCEACEYHDNFLHLYPYISVITNVEREHLDYFKTFENEKKSFEKFKNQSKIVFDKLKYRPKNVRTNKYGGVSFGLEDFGRINLKIGGYYNVSNAIFALQVCQEIGVPFGIIKLGLETFSGTQKRLQKVNFLGKEVIVDYAHHPTEIQNAYKFLCKLKKKIILIFQPHTFSRTKDFVNDFVKVLAKFDELYLFKTYSAREKESEGISAKELNEKIKKVDKKSTYISRISDVKKIIFSSSKKSLVVIMGAGDLPEKLGLFD